MMNLPEMVYLHEYSDLMTITKREFSNSDFLDYNWDLITNVIDTKYEEYLMGERDIEEMTNGEFEQFKRQIEEYLEEIKEAINKDESDHE